MREERDADRDNMKEIVWSKESPRKRMSRKEDKKKVMDEKKRCHEKENKEKQG